MHPEGRLSEADPEALFRRIAWRLMPFLFVCLVFNWLDRVAISFAHLQFRADLGIGDTAFGVSVGLFSIGYLLCEIPCNLVLERLGARRTLARIMILWGLVTIAMAFVRGPYSLYATRTVLGMAEAGFFPGVILYLTYWFPESFRARVTSRFVMAIAVCGIVGGPVSTWIMTHLSGAWGWRGWQWLFVLDGVPPVLAGLVAYRWLADRPAQAAWLTQGERHRVEQAAGGRHPSAGPTDRAAIAGLLRSRTLWCLTVAYCLTIMCTGNVVNFWVPSLLRASGVQDLQRIGLLSALPHVVGIVAMLAACRHSDRRRERRWHFALGGALAIAGMLALPATLGRPLLTVLLLTVLVSGYLIATAIFWSIPAGSLPPRGRAFGLAFINCCGQVSSMATPVMIGMLKSRLGSFDAALAVVSLMVAGGIATLLLGTSSAPSPLSSPSAPEITS